MENNPGPEQKILIVDDIPTNLDLLKGILQPSYTVFVAINGSIALQIAQTQEPDLILLDIMMPEMDGYEVCKRLKAHETTSKIPVIFVTAKGDPVDESKGFDAGCVDYIKKPVSPLIVSARVKTHLMLSRALHTLEQQNEELKKAAKLREDVERISRHDLKNPMSAIFSGLYFLGADPGLGKEAKEHIETINEAAQDMLNMINSSLDLFKMEQDIYRPSLEDVNIMDILTRIKRDLRALSSAKDSRIELKAPSGTTLEDITGYAVRGEPLLIYSMLVNLLKNALEATPANEPVTVALASRRDQAKIAIHNKGAIPKDIRDTVFDKFVTCGKQKGTGLGTYSARLIAKTLGGDIAMETSEQKGTTFTVSLEKGKEFGYKEA